MAAPVQIVYEYGPAGKCPVQAEGAINGREFYFRSRGMHWALHVSNGKSDPLASESWHYREEYKGVMAFRDDEINDGRRYAAGWAEEGECREFIERVAEKWAAQNTQASNEDPKIHD